MKKLLIFMFGFLLFSAATEKVNANLLPEIVISLDNGYTVAIVFDANFEIEKQEYLNDVELYSISEEFLTVHQNLCFNDIPDKYSLDKHYLYLSNYFIKNYKNKGKKDKEAHIRCKNKLLLYGLNRTIDFKAKEKLLPYSRYVFS